MDTRDQHESVWTTRGQDPLEAEPADVDAFLSPLEPPELPEPESADFVAPFEVSPPEDPEPFFDVSTEEPDPDSLLVEDDEESPLDSLEDEPRDEESERESLR
ncbi:MAG: hypothetical protein WBG57_07600 [Ornithinimicrobium sp.]